MGLCHPVLRMCCISFVRNVTYFVGVTWWIPIYMCHVLSSRASYICVMIWHTYVWSCDIHMCDDVWWMSLDDHTYDIHTWLMHMCNICMTWSHIWHTYVWWMTLDQFPWPILMWRDSCICATYVWVMSHVTHMHES